MRSVDVNMINNLDKNFVIDIREQEEWDYDHISGLKHIVMEELLKNPQKHLIKGETYYIMCALGGRSLRACSYLSDLDYDVVNLEKGIGGYIKN